MNETENNRNEGQSTPPKEPKKEKLGEKIGRLKKDAEVKFDRYLEERKKRLHENDAIFTEELTKEIQNYVKTHTAPYKYPRIVVFREELPKTISGKIMRNKL